ncbi:hypothetical protein [Acinetobacter seifertii]|uniref:hypothetical protein n=1 Tax=Acinetobacter seifertii TaxID=1530123 RepID=UPI003EE1B7E4
MIKVNFSSSDEFLTRYKQYVIIERLIPAFDLMVSKASESDKSRLLETFTYEFINDLILCKAEDLLGKITTIYEIFHELAERYCLEYYLKDIKLDKNIASTPIRKNTDRAALKVLHDSVVTELKLLSDNQNSILLPLIITQMENTSEISKMKKQLISINSMKLGNYILSDDEKELYPDWVNQFSNIFDYEAMATVFGHKITNDMELNVCLYCNNEDIESIKVKGAETRPDLDHFYPKSKFPFLALTLSNLIPAGSRCNQKYKRSNSMLEYVHPFIDGVTDERLFNFNYMFDEGRSNEVINITLNSLNNNLDKNLDLFKVEATHNKDNIKNWFLNLEERYQLLVNSSPDCFEDILNDCNLVRILLDVDINRSPRKEQFQKLKLDALSLLSNKNYKMVE